jgi:hypothetical protein
MVVPVAVKKSGQNPILKPKSNPPVASAPKAVVNPRPKPPAAMPQSPQPRRAQPTAKTTPQPAQPAPTPAQPPQPKKPTIQAPLPPALPPEPDIVSLPLPPALPPEPDIVSLPLPPPPVAESEEISAPPSIGIAGDRGVARVPSFASLWTGKWLRQRRPAAEAHVPPDATLPGRAEQRNALQLAGVLAFVALLGLLPVIVTGNVNLFAAPPWVLAVVFISVLQWVYAGWMINAPDWATARAQMAVCAVITTIYGMFMTLTFPVITQVNRPLILGLGEARRAAPAWCGLMLLVMGAATWYCGWKSATWRRNVLDGAQGDDAR